MDSVTQSNVSHAQFASVQGLVPVGPAGDPAVGLSPEALLEYISAKLHDSDGEIKNMLNHQKLVETEQQKLQSLMEQVNSLDSKINKDDNGNGILNSQQDCKDLEQAIEDTISQIQAIDPGCSGLGDLMALHDRVMATGTGPLDASGNPVNGSSPPAPVAHGYYNGSNAGPGNPPNGTTAPADDRDIPDGQFGSDELKDFADRLNSINSDLGSNAQIEMIQLQSKVSDRSTAIQLATNIMQSVYDAEQKTVANIHA